jgi:hypothetical protein
MTSIQFYFQASTYTGLLVSTEDETETHYHILFSDAEVKNLLGERLEYVYRNENLFILTERTPINNRLLEFFYDQVLIYRLQKQATRQVRYHSAR